MGINICLYKNHYDDHPEWDWLRQESDREFPKLIDWDDVVFNPICNENFRPQNFEKLRKKIEAQNWGDKARYHHLLDLLERDSEYYLYFSY